MGLTRKEARLRAEGAVPKTLLAWDGDEVVILTDEQRELIVKSVEEMQLGVEKAWNRPNMFYKMIPGVK